MMLEVADSFRTFPWIRLDDNPLFVDDSRFFRGSVDETRSHGGLLEPGTYTLVLVSDPLYVSAPLESRKFGGFDFTFDVSPAVPTPEPATIVLVGTGVLLVAGRKWRRR